MVCKNDPAQLPHLPRRFSSTQNSSTEELENDYYTWRNCWNAITAHLQDYRIEHVDPWMTPSMNIGVPAARPPSVLPWSSFSYSQSK